MSTTHHNRPAVLFTLVIFIAIFLLSTGACLAQRNRGTARPTPTAGSATSDDSASSRRNARINALQARFAPWLGVECKQVEDKNVKGALVVSVASGSPAEQAGLQPGDIITALDGKTVNSPEEFIKAASSLSIGKEYEISVVHGDRPAVRKIRPISRPTATFSSEISDTPAPRKGLLDINTLKYVLINPNTHEVTYIGTYDPAYNTGPIPYADYLKTAMDNAYPSISLEPGSDQQAGYDQIDKIISADINQMNSADYCNEWAQRLIQLLLYDNSVLSDSKRFFSNCASSMGITGDEMKRLFEGASGKIQVTPAELFTSVAKIMRGIGAPNAANGLLALAGGGSGPEEIMQNMANAMGLGDQYDALNRKYQSGSISLEQFRPEEIILCMSELCRQFETPESMITNTASKVRSGQSADLMIDLMSSQMGSFITNKAGSKMINGLVLGPEVLAKMYNLPVPSAQLIFKNVATDSMLADTLFKADYRLKSICAYPDAREKIHDHLTSLEFIQKEARAANYYMPSNTGAMIGHRLVPEDVKMRVSPNGDVVQFQDSKVKVLGWVMKNVGGNNKADEFIKTVAPKYGDYLTQHYNEYAKIYPEWHKLSEAAKMVALARWAKKNNYAINITDASGAKIQHPSSVEGFWSAVFQTDDNKPSLTVLQEGGASFGQDEGEDWVQPQSDVTVTSDVSKQLIASTVFAEQAADAALSGDLEGARDLAGKSALAMSGEIDLTKLPSLDGVPNPTEAASYASATSAVINEASDCMKKIEQAQNDLTRASQMAATSPDDASKLTQQATQAQDEAQARLKELLSSVASYKTDPSKAGAVVVALHGSSGVVTPSGGTTSPNVTGTTSAQGSSSGTATDLVDWVTQRAKMVAELEKVNQQIASTQDVLRKLNSSILSDRKMFDEWENDADAGFDRCVKMAGDVAVDFGAGELSDRYDEIYELAQKLPDKPADVIEKYRLLASLAHRLKEAKATGDYGDLAASEGKTDAELFQTMRDGIGQIMGLLGLDKTLPVAAWKYGSLACDMAYNLTELRQIWKNVSILEGNNDRYAEAVKKLTARMQELIKRQKDLQEKIDAGEQVNFNE